MSAPCSRPSAGALEQVEHVDARLRRGHDHRRRGARRESKNRPRRPRALPPAVRAGEVPCDQSAPAREVPAPPAGPADPGAPGTIAAAFAVEAVQQRQGGARGQDGGERHQHAAHRQRGPTGKERAQPPERCQHDDEHRGGQAEGKQPTGRAVRARAGLPRMPGERSRSWRRRAGPSRRDAPRGGTHPRGPGGDERQRQHGEVAVRRGDAVGRGGPAQQEQAVGGSLPARGGDRPGRRARRLGSRGVAGGKRPGVCSGPGARAGTLPWPGTGRAPSITSRSPA